VKSTANSEAEKFDVVVRKLLSVSHEEIQKRDKEWRRNRAREKQGKVRIVGREKRDT
jgi:hypothetical protein